MECGSKYAWLNTDEDEASVEVENMGDNLWTSPAFGSSSAPSSAPPPPPVQAEAFAATTTATTKRKVRFRQADTNIISINFGTLVEGVQISTGDAVMCKGCGSVLSSLSELTSIEEKKESTKEEETSSDAMEVDKEEQEEEGEKCWNCEFCGVENSISIEPEEIPTEDSVDYILAPPAELEKKSDEDMVVFVLDISGSMCVSYEVEGKVSLRGGTGTSEAEQFAERNASGAMAEQWLPNERKNVTYITRLQCVQAAIASEIERMHKEHPHRRVGLVTFNSEVTLMGDGSQPPVTIAGDKLNNLDQLLQIGSEFSITKTISESKEILSKKLFSLEETGATALGPALVTALGMTSSQRGSKIVICTDGLSNVGLGSMDELHTDEDKDAVEQFYRQMGTLAQSKGTSVSIVSIKGSDCSMENVGLVAEISGGQVDRVSPLEITKNFQSILSLPVIATHVTATIRLHKALQIRVDDDVREMENEEVRDIGNVTKESGVSFEYRVRKHVKKEELANLKFLPFQVQIRYTKLDGMKCMRVISKKQLVTFDRNEAEGQANFAVLGMNAVQQTAKLASQGNYAGARAYNLSNKVMLNRAVRSPAQQQQYAKWESMGKKFEDELSTVQRQEISEGLNDLDDDSEEEEKEEQGMERSSSFSFFAKKAKKKEKVSKTRRNKRDDNVSNMLYQMKSAPSSNFGE